MVKTQWIHKARKEMVNDYDTDEKDRVRKILHKDFGLHAIQDETLFFDRETGEDKFLPPTTLTKQYIFKKYFVHRPDLLLRDHRIIVEIDGDIHWQNSKASKATNARNEHYEDAGFKLIWLTRDEVRKLGDNELTALIRQRLNEPAGGLP